MPAFNLTPAEQRAVLAYLRMLNQTGRSQPRSLRARRTMPFSTFNCSPELLTAAKRLADQYGTGMTIHHSISPQNRKTFLEKYGKPPTLFFEEIGPLGPNVLLAHVMGLDDIEIDCVARTRTNVVMCPSNVLRAGGGIKENGKMPEMLEKGVNVGLGSESANSSNHTILFGW